MKYILSQSFHTLNHWQSGKSQSGSPTPTHKPWFSGVPDWGGNGFIKDDKLYIPPWAWHENGSVPGEMIIGNPGSNKYPSTGYYLPSLSGSLVYSGQWVTDDPVYVGLSVQDLGSSEMVPEAVPFTYNGSITARYAILKPVNNRLVSDGKTYYFTFGGSYVGGLMLPTTHRWRMTFYASDTEISGLPYRGKVEVAISQPGDPTDIHDIAQWTGHYHDIYLVMQSAMKGASKDEEMAFVNMSPSVDADSSIWVINNSRYYHFGSVCGGYSIDGKSGYRAGVGNEVAYNDSEVRVPTVAFGMTNAQAPAGGYSNVSTYVGYLGNGASNTQEIMASAPLLLCDGSENPAVVNLAYSGGKRPYHVTNNGTVETVYRKCESVRLVDGFKFFT